MKKYHIILLVTVSISCNNNSSQAEKDYIKNLESKNAALEKELQDTKHNSQEKSNESTKNSNNYFTIGSTEQEVIKVMGEPNSYHDSGLFKIFEYGMSSVTFENGKVKSYDNMDDNLKVKLRN